MNTRRVFHSRRSSSASIVVHSHRSLTFNCYTRNPRRHRRSTALIFHADYPAHSTCPRIRTSERILEYEYETSEEIYVVLSFKNEYAYARKYSNDEYIRICIDTVENMHVLLFENYSKDKQGNMERYTCIIVRKYSKNGYMHGEIFVYYRRKVFEGWVGTEKYTYCTKCVWKYIIRNIRKNTRERIYV